MKHTRMLLRWRVSASPSQAASLWARRSGGRPCALACGSWPGFRGRRSFCFSASVTCPSLRDIAWLGLGIKFLWSSGTCEQASPSPAQPLNWPPPAQACMLVFHPDLGSALPDAAEKSEVVICLDCSSSMDGVTFLHAKQIALYALSLVGQEQKVNVVKFGSGERLGSGRSVPPLSRTFVRG